jgi:hypothetical protein
MSCLNFRGRRRRLNLIPADLNSVMGELLLGSINQNGAMNELNAAGLEPVNARA